jgi:hypothetical protein
MATRLAAPGIGAGAVDGKRARPVLGSRVLNGLQRQRNGMALADLFLGVDGGGTRCRARLEDHVGKRLGEGLAGPANLRLGQQASLDAVLDTAGNAPLPDLMFMPGDADADGLRRLAAELGDKGAAVLQAGSGSEAGPRPGLLPALAPDHPETDAACLIQSFYAIVVDLAERLGIDADRPRHLQKVTRTR